MCDASFGDIQPYLKTHISQQGTAGKWHFKTQLVSPSLFFPRSISVFSFIAPPSNVLNESIYGQRFDSSYLASTSLAKGSTKEAMSMINIF